MKMPKLRFKADDGSDFQEWEKISLGEIFTISAGGDLDKSKSADKQNESFPYPVYSNSLQNKGLFGYASYYKIDGNTFTVTGRGDVGHAIARHEKYVPIVRLLVCKPKFDDNVDFFAEQVNLAKFANESTGVPQLTAPKLKELKVSRPSIAEQYKIANLLLAVDAVIEKQQAEITAWEQYKNCVAQKLFDQEVHFKADDGSDFPEWEKMPLGEIFTVSAGGDLDKSKSTDKPSDSFPFPVYTNSLQNNGLFGYASYYKVEGNTFTVTGRGDVGHAVARHEKYVPIVRLLVCKPKFGDNVDFFAEQVNLAKFASESTGVPQLTAPKLKELKVSRPSIAEQRKIAECLDAINDVIALSKAELEKWRELKKGLLQQLFV